MGLLLRLAARAAVRRSKHAEEILKSIQDGLVALDREFRFTYVNRAAAILMGKPHTELLGKNVWEVYPEFLGTTVEANFHRAIGERIPVHFEASHSISNKWADVSLYPTGNGGLTVWFREITEGKRAKAALLENEERYRFDLEAANVGTWEWSIATG